jgi:hypothetical protein
MTVKQTARFRRFKQRQAEQQRRLSKARALCAKAGSVDDTLALEILKAQERAAARKAKREAIRKAKGEAK